MVTIAEGFTTCIESGDCLSVVTNPTATAAIYAELEIDPVGGIRCTSNGLAATGGASLALPESPSCVIANPGLPLSNALGVLGDGSPFIPDHFVGDKFAFFNAGIPLGPAIPVNTYAATVPVITVTNSWCRDAVILAYLFSNANVRTDIGSRFEFRTEVQIDGGGFVPVEHTPIILANSPTIRIQQDKAASASLFTDPYGFLPITIPSGTSKTIQFRNGVFANGGGSAGLWANVGTFLYAALVTTET